MIFKKMQFWNTPNDGDGGSAVDFLGPVDLDGDTIIADDIPQGSPQSNEVPKAAPAPTVDAAALAKEFGQVLGQFQQKPQPQAQAPLDPKEAARLLNVWEPDDVFLQQFGNIETQKQAFALMRDNLIRQADTIAQVRMQQMQQDWEQRFTPVQQLIEQRHAAETEGRFHASYPELANPALREVIGTVVNKLQASGKFPNNEADAFKAIASNVEAILQVGNPTFKLGAQAPQSKSPTRTRGGGIPVTTPGSGGGAGSGGGGGNASAGPKAVSLFPKIG
jgi:hypothetical protein